MSCFSSYVHHDIWNGRTKIKLCLWDKQNSLLYFSDMLFFLIFRPKLRSAYYTEQLSMNSSSSHVHHDIWNGRTTVNLYLWDKLNSLLYFKDVLFFQILSSKINECVLYRGTLDELFFQPCA